SVAGALVAHDAPPPFQGIPAIRALTSASRKRRWPVGVRIDVSLPLFAHLVTVFGSTRKILATSPGVSSRPASGSGSAIAVSLAEDAEQVRERNHLKGLLPARAVPRPPEDDPE